MRFAALVLRVRLFCEKLTDILEGFELEGVAGRVEEEHGGLFAREVFEADIGFDDKFDPAGFEPAFQLVPVFPVQYYTIMRDGYVMTIDGIMVQTFRYGRPGFQVNDELMTKEIKVNPVIGASAFFAAQYIAVKSPGFGEIVDRDGYVKGSDLFHVVGRVGQKYNGIH